MAQGKPAGMRCIQLDASNRCQLFGDPRRPAVCTSLQPSIEMCGSEQAHALRYLDRLEALTAPFPHTQAAWTSLSFSSPSSSES